MSMMMMTIDNHVNFSCSLPQFSLSPTTPLTLVLFNNSAKKDEKVISNQLGWRFLAHGDMHDDGGERRVSEAGKINFVDLKTA